MEIVTKSIHELTPYEKNARKNNKAVPLVAKSIEQFGFKVPIVIDRNNVIVCGHTRYKAAHALGIEEVPCIIADDLNDQQIKAYRLADNKVAEVSKWDKGILSLEMNEIFDFDMSEFGFEIADPVDTVEVELPQKDNERERTANAYNLYEFDENRCTGIYDIPTLDKVIHTPKSLMGFNYCKSTPPQDGIGVHFFLDDYQFERIWNSPADYCAMLADYDCVLTPDFSLYMNMPIAMMIWNTYRSRLIGQMMQDYGCTVIPTVSWAGTDSYDFAFDGLPTGGTIAVSTIGVKRNKDAFDIWVQGMDECLKFVKPHNVIVYGGDIGYTFDCDVTYISNAVTDKMKG
jgi:hypothetical protein